MSLEKCPIKRPRREEARIVRPRDLKGNQRLINNLGGMVFLKACYTFGAK